MIDVQYLRTELSEVATRLKSRGYNLDTKNFSALEEKRKKMQIYTEQMQAERNQLSKTIGFKKRQNENTEGLQSEVMRLNQELAKNEKKWAIIQEEFNNWLLQIPNLPDQSVPIGKDETDNLEIKRVGTPRNFTFPIKDQVALGKAFGLAIEDGVKLSGSRFSVMKGKIARLHRALAQFMLDLHTEQHGYTEYYTPYIVNADVLYGTGQLPKFAEDMYQVFPGGKEGASAQYLISTAEIPLTTLTAGEVLAFDALPLKLTAHTPCFRSEAGSHGKDTHGLIRQHQFDKVELVNITHPECSYQDLEILRESAERVLQALELPYRVMLLCTGDMGFSASKTYDLEVWVPSEHTYREISSCSNCEAFQARRMKTRYKDAKGKKRFVHTLNGSGVAVGRALVALLENHQQEDGSLYLPPPLRPYFSGQEYLHPES